MPTVMSPIYRARSFDVSIASDNTEVLDFSFRLGLEQGIQLYQSAFTVGGDISLNGESTVDNWRAAYLQMSLHRRMGTLVDPFPDTGVATLQSEVLHDVTLHYEQSYYQGLTGGTNRGWDTSITGSLTQNYIEILGGPLVLAGDLSIQMTAFAVNGAMTFNGAGCSIFYRYVKLTPKEMQYAYFGRP